jgi:hypothetical protein
LALKRRIAWSRIVWTVIVISVVIYSIVWTSRAYARFGEQLTVLGEIGLGDSRGEIKYVMGVPPVVYGNEDPNEPGLRIFYTDPQKDPALPAGADINTYHTWSYDSGPSLDPHLDITFDPRSGRVSRIDCVDQSQPPTAYCSRLVGAGIGDPESRIAALFGVPTRQSIDDRTGVKTMDYDDIGVMFLLARQRVYALSVVGAEAPRQVPLARFLIWATSDLRTEFRL